MKPDIDDGLDDLPAMDGDEEGDEGGKDEVDLTIPGGPSRLPDDGTADDLDVGDPIGEGPADAGSGDELWDGDTADKLPIGDDRSPLRPEDDEPGIGDSEIQLDDDPRAQDKDGGDDGPSDDDDLPFDRDLPAMDADDEGDFEERLVEEMGLADEPPSRRARPVLGERDGFALAVPADPLAQDALLVSVPDFEGVVLASVRDGILLIDRRGTVAPRNVWRELPGAPRFFAGPDPLCVALGPSRVLWLATPGGRLLRGQDLGETWEDAGQLQRSVRALDVRVDGTLSALSTDQPALSIITSTGGRSWFDRPLLAPSVPYRKGRSWLSQSGLAVAVGHENAFVLVSRDGGLSYQETEVAGAVAGVFAGDGTRAPLLVASVDDANGLLRIVRIDAHGSVDIVAETAAWDEDDPSHVPRTLVALAWDAAREWVWAFSGGRLSAFGSRQLQ